MATWSVIKAETLKAGNHKTTFLDNVVNQKKEVVQSKTKSGKKEESELDSILARFEPNNSLQPEHLSLALTDVSDPKLANSVKTQAVETPEVISIHRFKGTERAEKAGMLVEDIISSEPKIKDIDKNLAKAIAEIESSFDPNARSQDGFDSKGLFQLLDSTGRQVLGKHFPSEEYSPFDPRQNIRLGGLHLQHLSEIFQKPTQLSKQSQTYGSKDKESLEKFIVAAYNSGEGRVAWAQKQARNKGVDPTEFNSIQEFLPKSTQNYVEKVLSAKLRYLS
jgi:hypothetical protein